MSNKKYQTIVLLGRFQPVHNAHLEILRRASIMADQVIVIVGSAQTARSYKNPWDEHERIQMITSMLSGSVIDSGCQVFYESNTDSIYNDQAWAARVQEIVEGYTGSEDRIAIIGHEKDASSFYLKMFPQWSREEVPLLEPLNATDIRDLYFRVNANMNFIRGVVPPEVFTFMEEFRLTEDYDNIIKEREFLVKFKQPYATLPYPPIFVTADALVVCAGHVLMVKRRAMPGKGLMALPGGYVNAYTDSSIENAAVRELREETRLKVPEPIIRGSIVRSKVFDAVDRSSRGRIITHCFLIQLPDGELPRVKGGDDALVASWVPISQIKRTECFEDHAEIIHDMLGF